MVGGTGIAVNGTMKYEGLVLNKLMEVRDHFRLVALKLGGTAPALGRLLPIMGKQNASCRRPYEGVVRSMALYRAPT